MIDFYTVVAGFCVLIGGADLMIGVVLRGGDLGSAALWFMMAAVWFEIGRTPPRGTP